VTRGEGYAVDLEQATEQLIEFIESCTDEQWSTLVPGEEWTVGVLVHHCAVGNDSARGWLGEMVDGSGVITTDEQNDAANARHAEEFADVTRGETIGLLQRTAPATAAYLRGLSDEELDRSAPFGPAGGAVLTADRFAQNVSRHPLGHLEHARAALGAS
jgi:hypothetical protein